MCDVRLFKSAYLDYQAALTLYKTPFPDEMFLNIAAYHLQQCGKNIEGCPGMRWRDCAKYTPDSKAVTDGYS